MQRWLAPLAQHLWLKIVVGIALGLVLPLTIQVVVGAVGGDRAVRAVMPWVLVFIIVSLGVWLVVNLARRRRLFQQAVAGSLGVEFSEEGLHRAGRAAKEWAPSRGYGYLGNWRVMSEGQRYGQFANAVFHRPADETVIVVNGRITGCLTYLSDGRRLVTATLVAVALPGTIQQRLATNDLDRFDDVHREALALLAQQGVTPLPPPGGAVAALLAEEVEEQQLVTTHGGKRVRAMMRDMLKSDIGTLADGKALETPSTTAGVGAPATHHSQTAPHPVPPNASPLPPPPLPPPSEPPSSPQ